MKNLLAKRVLKMTLVISLLHLLVLVLVSCLDETSIEDPFGECATQRAANTIGLKIQYFPYEKARYSIKQTQFYGRNLR